VAVTALVAWASLAACYLGPLPEQYAALAVVDGRPTAVVAVCERPTVTVRIYRHENVDGELHRWSVTVTPRERVRDVEVELLGAPQPGWEITPEARTADPGLSFDVVPLTKIEAGHRYTLDSSEPGPEGTHAHTVSFTTDDLPKIGEGQVLAPKDDEHSKLVSRDSFVKKRCD
jgi:hypothetical protein